MKLLPLFRNGKVKPAWEFKTTGNLWRFLFSPTGKIVGEDRNPTAKTVSFFCLNERTGETHWSGLMLDEKWWIGIETVSDTILYLHEYVKPDLPQHFKIIAIDLETGKILWRNDELEPLFVARGRLYAARDMFEKRMLYELNSTTGKIEREFSEEDSEVSLRQQDEAEDTRGTVFPEVFEEGVENYHELAPLIDPHCDRKKLVGEVEIILRDPLLFLSYYERASRSSDDSPLTHHLKVISRARGRLIFSEVLNDAARAPVPDSFFLRGEQLFFVKNKNTLVAIHLKELEQKV